MKDKGIPRFKNRFNRQTVHLMAGETHICNTDIIIVTVLGSCISVCLYSEISAYCGMNHFMLPDVRMPRPEDEDIMHAGFAMYGIAAMEKLINGMLRHGLKKESLKAKVFGGGNVLSLRTGDKSVGQQNIEFTLGFLKNEKIEITACSLGGFHARKIYFFTATHEVFQHKLERKDAKYIEAEERNMRFGKVQSSDITFFNNG
jgi:chemotaxis protein CheD